MEKPLQITLQEAARLMSCSTKTVQRLAQAGKLTDLRSNRRKGTKLMLDPGEIEAYVFGRERAVAEYRAKHPILRKR